MSAHSSPATPATRRLRSVWLLSVVSAFGSLRESGFRALLTILGVVIGVASVIILVAFGEGARREITSQIDTLGAGVAILVPGKLQGQSNFNPMGGMGLSNLTERDVAAVRAVPGVRAAAPITFLGGGVYRGKEPAEICMPIATTPPFRGIRRLEIADGRFFGPEDGDRAVCVLGTGIKEDLFGEERAVGQSVSVNDVDYRVIGVAGERSMGSGLFGGEELDAIVYLPFPAVRRVTGMTLIHRVFIEVEPSADPEKTVEAVRQAVLRTHGGRDDFSLVRSKELLQMFYKIFVLLAALLLGITSISLIVGGIGIMNVMLVTVTERTREIGIRKTVGARRSDVFFQFLTEAVVLSGAGGLLGIVLAVATCQVIAGWLPLKPVITVGSVLLGFGVCVVVGILSGVLPAIAAARKDPIEAIRHE